MKNILHLAQRVRKYIYIYFFKSLAIYIFWPILISVLLTLQWFTYNGLFVVFCYDSCTHITLIMSYGRKWQNSLGQ